MPFITGVSEGLAESGSGGPFDLSPWKPMAVLTEPLCVPGSLG